ncbi:hypothetical protein PCANC_05719 [Puccinia coronata f. sp. avenae]|uniref:Uncharacterized protein n=1 Tax=Puccinia coronata f. sp. avenae TaxID=200324 RepID=A0A2N5VAE0_9BASI|nr:hypothetical protein PCANC_06072 [Puccinia coronata f. sp. avenae]PLW46963.1 hypothetical protein PCANC_06550 [Puccinia coronata f. sp. avenae]PLW52950.1 hypothetical protein PCANC_05719 [Puccinia coronata f. sp. avenae]
MVPGLHTKPQANRSTRSADKKKTTATAMQKTSSLSSLFSLDKPTPLTDTGTGPKKQPKSANTKRNSAHPSDQPKHKPAQPNGKPHGKQQDTKHDDKDLELPDQFGC